MANIKEVRKQIGSIQSTQKITSAMETVAASKMRRAEERMRRGSPYTAAMRRIIGHMAHATVEYRHSYMQVREVRNAIFVIISTDKGLCGGLNINLFRTVVRRMKELSDKGVGVKVAIIGAKAADFFKNMGSDVLSAKMRLGDQPSVEDLIGGVSVVLDAYNQGEADQVFLCSNRFVNTMTQAGYCDQLLPLSTDFGADEAAQYHWDYIYEPEAHDLMDGLMVRYIESLVYQAVVENGACEQAAKMVAMKNATENAGKLIDELQLLYNNARQAAITQELAEIVGGAAAV